jgi:VWFA-related protein
MKRAISGLLVLFAASAFAQQLSETVNVEVIQVPVYVIGPDGNPIKGLKKSQFELWIDGQPKPVEYFDQVDVATPLAADEVRPEKQRRLYLLLFDLSCTADDCQGLPARIARAQRAAAVSVEHSHLDSDLFAVATYTTNHGVQFATPFLRDRAAVRRAIATLSASNVHDPLGLAISTSEARSWLRESSANVDDQVAAALEKGDVVGSVIASTIAGGVANQDNVRQPLKRVIEAEFDNLKEVATRLASLEGQKHIVLFSQGFRTELLHGANDTPTVDNAKGFDSGLLMDLRIMAEGVQQAGVFIDTVDIYGLRPDVDTSYNNDGLQILAHSTGGEFVHNRNDFASAITDLTKRQQVAYLLGFDRHDLTRGKIVVKVNGVPRGTHLTYRQGFGDPPSRTDIDPLQLADIVVNDLPQTGVNMSMGVVKGPSIVVAISKKEILPQLVDAQPWIETILYVFDGNGAAVMSKQKRITFDEATRKADGPIVIGQKLDLPAGKYVAKAITRIGGTTSVGYAKYDFNIE